MSIAVSCFSSSRSASSRFETERKLPADPARFGKPIVSAPSRLTI